MNATPAPSHIGILVFDLEASLRFYTEGLGFSDLHSLTVGGPQFGALYEFDDFECEVHFLKNGTLVVEVIHLTSPQPTAWAGREPLNVTGIGQLAFRVDDADEVAGRLARLGGKVLEHTRTPTVGPDGVERTFIACLDPDGIRIQLMEGDLPDAVR
ncbi:VOC family protein [Streptomyces sp. NPDC047072]|uniref:VOC family protein n=1 Tax=Streptomyces sp. NPDC047072 TaxID=3154809 RepID=UPI0033DA25C8